MNYDLNEVVNRRGTNSGKWEFMDIINPKTSSDTLPFWVADMDFPCPEGVLEALHKRTDRAIFGYSAEYTGEFYRSVCGWFQHRFDWYVNSSDIFYCSGIVPALGFLVEIMTKEGDQVIVQPPVYRPFYKKIDQYHRKAVSNKLIEKNGIYEIDFEDFEKKAKDPKTTLFILCSPHNPVGRVWTEEELIRLGEICFANGVKIVADEIHHDIIMPGNKHIPIAKLFPSNLNEIVVCTSVSKSFNLAGLAYSNIIIHDAYLKIKWNEFVREKIGVYYPNPLGITAVQAAYESGEKWLETVNNYILENFRFVKKILEEKLPKSRMTIPEATYFAWVDIGAYLTDEMRKDIDSYLAEIGDVLIEGGSIFGSGGENYIRINLACPISILEEGMNRICKVLGRLHQGDEAPDFTYQTPWTENNKLSNVINKPTYLMFLRYHGCTLCHMDISNLISEYDKIKASGAQVLVVLQSTQEVIKEQIKEGEVPFEFICDPEQKLYQLYNVSPAISMSKMANMKVLQKIGMAANSGFTHGKYEGNELQLPALLLIDNNKNVIKSHYAKDVSDVPSVDEMLSWL